MHLGLGRLLLAELLEHATQRELVYRHAWRMGDLVMWDNRCVLHRGRRYDLSQRRELRRVTTERSEERRVGKESVDLGGRRIIKKKKQKENKTTRCKVRNN